MRVCWQPPFMPYGEKPNGAPYTSHPSVVAGPDVGVVTDHGAKPALSGRRSTVDELDMVALERLGIGGIDAADMGEDIVAQHGPAECQMVGHLPPEPARVRQILREMRAIDERLLRHTFAGHEGPADAMSLRNRHPRVVRGSLRRRARPPEPAPMTKRPKSSSDIRLTPEVVPGVD